MPISPVLSLREEDLLYVLHGESDDIFRVVDAEGDHFTLLDILGERGEFEVDGHEISDMANGAKSFMVHHPDWESD